MARFNPTSDNVMEPPILGSEPHFHVGDLEVCIRPVGPQDFAYCRRLHMENMYALISTHWGWDPDRFLDEFVPSEMRLVDVNGHRCGYYRLSIVDEHLYVDDIQLSAAWRGLGIGTALLGAFDLWARSKRVNRIRLLCFADNPALRLYRRHGYTALVDRGTSVLMEKRLNGHDVSAVSSHALP